MHIAFLNAYLFDEEDAHQKTYAPQMMAFLKSCWPNAQVDVFETGLGSLPEELTYDLFVIGGSTKSSYDEDPWIFSLKKFITELHTENKKLLGICFGHQLIALSLGGDVEKHPRGWEIGAHNISIEDKKDWMTPPLENLKLLFIHQDQVSKLPKNAELIATNDFCKNQVYSINDTVLTFQGHPEFTTPYLKNRLIELKDLFAKDKFDVAMNSFEEPRNENEIQNWLKDFFNDSN